MKKTISLLLALCCLFAVLTGCGGSKKTMEPRAFVDDVLANANFTDSLSQLDDAVIPQYYGVDSADYKSALVYCGTAATAEQIVASRLWMLLPRSACSPRSRRSSPTGSKPIRATAPPLPCRSKTRR